ncbi:putative mitochondrial hypothetical protein [Leptomonas pyrrhocoris]|uniref:Uncharacterized protein n=1 Tax=Leptomonas pyrrhocoris TaxID=157538 RepID=A0A0N0VH36_LEPPY|nr:putative mitochondrial hypothetical protein [Leptomonas pyrrhocoris]KPA84614.1 putative mitochondrial hypothetical protein [Leptomonas pyrrhocoris]|eukprot:XP_015663053.1 putative mitochondrial hypothetical protein [Leptomonas pyrrhocoris]
MIIAIAAFVVVFLICWYLNFRPRSTNQLKPLYTSRSRPEKVQRCDYVVVGAGAAGLSAVAALLHQTSDDSHVLLIEGGPDPQPSSALTLLLSVGRRDRLLSFAPDLVRVPAEALPRGAKPTFMGLPTPDEGYQVQRPWHFSKVEEDKVAAAAAAVTTAAESKANRYRLLQYTPLPRGVGVGGTGLLDWGMHLNSIWPAHDVASASAGPTTALWARVPVHFPALRNPLSWAFAETVKTAELAPPYLPTADAPVKHGTVFPAYLYLDKDGRRLAMPSAVLADIAPDVLRRRLSVLTGYTVVDVELENSAADKEREEEADIAEKQRLRRVCGVCVRRSGAPSTEKPQTILLTKGVVLSAGAVHSPQLLHDIVAAHNLTLPVPLPTSVPLRDAVALPLIFASMPAVSADSFNARDTKGAAMWWMTQRGPFLAPLGDTAASLPLPQIGPQAELRILLLPFGGRDATRFKSMGWDTVLATPLQAYTMLLIVQGIDGLQHQLTLNKTIAPPGAAHALGLCPHHPSPTLSEEVHRQVQEALLCGIKECRRLTKKHPLSSLSLHPGAESVDFTCLVPVDEAKAVRLAQLSRQMPSKRTARNKAELNELMLWARQQLMTEPYMRRYVDAHAYWLGFASGSSETFLASPSSSMRVAGLENVVVGDASAVTAEQWSTVGKRDTLAAASRSTTMHAAEKAVTELVKAP